MRTDNEYCKRLGLFLVHDPDGIVDDYIVYLLRDMRRNLSDLILLVNGKLTDEGRRKLEEFTDEIHVRPNKGFDAGAWKEGLLVHCGFDRLRTYDQLVLFNDSFFGPLYPFSEVFEEMDRRSVDFWGLSVHGELKGTGLCPYGYRPRYLQTYFLVFGKRLFLASEFQDFWEQQPLYRRFEELAEKFGAVLTRHFADLGYSWSTYSDTTDLESDREKNFDQHSFNLSEMVVHRRYPVIKRRSFLIPKETYLRYGNGNELWDALEHVKAHSAYDLNLVFRHLLRKYGLGDLKESLNLNWVLPAGENPPKRLPAGKKIAIVAHLHYPDLFDYDERYLRNIPPEADVFITIDTEEKKQEIQRRLSGTFENRLRVLRVQPRGRDWGALLTGCKSLLAGYEYLGFVHDKKSPQKEYATVGAAFRDLLWENMLASEGYVRRVLATFEDNPWLGLLVPPAPIHGTYFKTGMDRWTICFDETVRLARRLGLATHLDPNQQPIAVGSVFWCRRTALEPLFAADWHYEDFPPEPLAGDGTLNHALERILPYVAQSQGYLTGWVMTDRQASIEIANLRYMMDITRHALSGMPGVRFSTFHAFRRSLAAWKWVLRLVPGLDTVLDKAGKLRGYAAAHSPAFVRKWYTHMLLCRTPRPPSSSKVNP